MTDKKYNVKRGQQVDLQLLSDAKTALGQESRNVQKDGFVGVEDEDEQYIFQKKRGNITFYDLGTRMNEDGTYRHLDLIFEIENDIPLNAIDIAKQQYNNQMFVDNFEQSLQLPQQSEFLFLDLHLTRSTEEEGEVEQRKILIGELDRRSFIDDNTYIGESEAPFETARQTQTTWDSAAAIFSMPGEWAISLKAGFFYHTLGFHSITNVPLNEPPYESEDFLITSRDVVKIYLAPRMYLMTNQDNVWIFARLPVVPDFINVKTNSILQRMYFNAVAGVFGNLSGNSNESFWEVFKEYAAINPNLVAAFESPFTIFTDAYTDVELETSWNSLSAIIVKNDETFYLWRGLFSENNSNSFVSSIHHPDFEIF